MLCIRTVEHGNVAEESYVISMNTLTQVLFTRDPQILLDICFTLQDTTLGTGRAIPRTLRQQY